MIRRFIYLLALAALSACTVVDATPRAITGPTLAPATDAPAVDGATSADTPAASAGDTSWYRLYFTNPPDYDDVNNRPTDTIVDAMTASLNSATRTIDAATYDFDLPQMAQAFIAAKKRGLTVRVVTDTDTMGEDVVKQIKKAGITVVEDHRDAIMHDKFLILDGLVVWTGSWNFSQNDNYRNNNNFIGIASPEMVANYQTEFNEMFEGRKFGPTSPADTPYPQFSVAGTLIENYFSPEDNPEPRIVAAIQAARQSVYFAAFTFTSPAISKALIDQAKAGVKVEGVYERRQVEAGSDESYNKLKAAKLPVLLDGNRHTMHHKFFVIDGQVVVTGSFNFTRAANEQNDENVLIIHNSDIAAQYYQEFLKVWAKAGGS